MHSTYTSTPTHGRQFVLHRVVPGLVIGYGFYVCDHALDRKLLGEPVDPEMDCSSVSDTWSNRSYVKAVCQAQKRLRRSQVASESLVVIMQVSQLVR